MTPETDAVVVSALQMLEQVVRGCALATDDRELKVRLYARAEIAKQAVDRALAEQPALAHLENIPWFA
jgi:hypothetical protein